MAKRKMKHPTPGDVLLIIGIAALMGLAIREQVQMPKDQRTWHGTLFNIPYDFRWPTIERLRETFWNKETARVGSAVLRHGLVDQLLSLDQPTNG